MKSFPTTVPHGNLFYPVPHEILSYPSISWNPFLPQYLIKSFPTLVPHEILSYHSTSWNPLLPPPPLYHPSSPPLLISFTTSTSSSPLQPKFKSSYSLVSISAWKTLLSGSSYFILTTFYSNPCRLTPPPPPPLSLLPFSYFTLHPISPSLQLGLVKT